MMYTPSFGAGCYENPLHGPSRSSPGRAGSCDTAGIGIGIPSCSHCDSRNTQPDGRHFLHLPVDAEEAAIPDTVEEGLT